MTNSQKWLLLCGVLALGAFAFADPPAALNNELRFSRSDESTFIEATRPQVIGSGKYGTDAGRLYVATDGGWRVVPFVAGIGSVTLSGGNGSAPVAAGATCVCSSTTANPARCSLAASTLTVTGTGSDVVTYICL